MAAAKGSRRCCVDMTILRSCGGVTAQAFTSIREAPIYNIMLGPVYLWTRSHRFFSPRISLTQRRCRSWVLGRLSRQGTHSVFAFTREVATASGSGGHQHLSFGHQCE